MSEIDVTILCLAYNHERYIKDALEGFIKQKTKYKFEILIHDDASTDSTKSIIESYQKQYPDLVFPYYEEVNQYSNPNSLFVRDILIKNARGRYIAFCDGDDYWTDEQKLEKQIDVLEKYQDINICACSTLIESNGNITGSVSPMDHDGVLTFEQVVNGGGDYVGTASLVFRKKIFDNYPVPERIGTLDYIMQMCGSINGGMYYINTPTCVYRRLTPGSWTRKTRLDLKTKAKTYSDIVNALKKIDAYTDNKYKDVIDEKIRRFEFEILFANDDYKKMKSDHYIDLYKEIPLKRKIKKRILKIMIKFHK